MKDKHLTIRISSEIYKLYVEETIRRTIKENKIIKISEVIREVLERGINND